MPSFRQNNIQAILRTIQSGMKGVNINESIVNDSFPLMSYTRLFNIAEINQTDIEILPAINNTSYRIIDGFLLNSTTFNSTGATDIRLYLISGDIKKSLVIFPTTALTAGKLVRAGDSNTTILAGGFGFNYFMSDRMTPVTIGKTGPALGGASYYTISVNYSLIQW